jgi:hypothetical protein
LKIQIQICFDTQKKEEKYWLTKKRKIQYKRLGFFLLLNAIASIPICAAAAFRILGIGGFLAVATSLFAFIFAIEWLVRIQRREIVVKLIFGAIRFLIVVLLGILCSGFLISMRVLEENTNWSFFIFIGSIILATVMEYGISAAREHFSEKWCNKFLFISCCVVAVLILILFGFPGERYGDRIVLFVLFVFVLIFIPPVWAAALALEEEEAEMEQPLLSDKTMEESSLVILEEEEAEMEQPLLSDKTMETTEEFSPPNTVITCPACGEMMVVPKSAYGSKFECVCGHKWVWE